MNDIERIYSLLLHSNGLKIRAISQELKLDKYYVAEIMFSPQNISYWYQDDDSMWFAKEGALHIEEKTEDKLTTSIVIPRKIKTERFLQGNPSRSLLSQIKKLSYYRTYTESEIKELIRRYRDGDMKAYEMLVKSQQKLVTSIAFLLRKEGSQLEDLIQEGNIGLIIAINRFDYERYNTFIVYAKAWIMQSITNFISNTMYHVRVPLNMLSQYKKTQKFIEKFTQKNEYPPSLYDIEIDEDVFSGQIYEDCTLYIPRGTKAAYEAAEGWKNFFKIEEFGKLVGDVNGDDEVNITDVTLIASYILGNQAESFDETVADMNDDGKIDIADVTSIINTILNQ